MWVKDDEWSTSPRDQQKLSTPWCEILAPCRAPGHRPGAEDQAARSGLMKQRLERAALGCAEKTSRWDRHTSSRCQTAGNAPATHVAGSARSGQRCHCKTSAKYTQSCTELPDGVGFSFDAADSASEGTGVLTCSTNRTPPLAS